MAGFFEKLNSVSEGIGKFAGAVSPFVSVGVGLAQAFKGAKQAKQAREAKMELVNNRQDLKNITEGMRVSTLGAQLQTQEAQRRFATSVDALRSGGVRGLVGGLGQMEQQQQFQQQQISADLDKQQQQIDVMRAQDESRIRDMQESREEFKIGMLAGEEAAGRNRMLQGVGLGMSGLKSMIPEAGEARPKDNPLSTGTKQGSFVDLGNTSSQYDLAKQENSMDKGLVGLLGAQNLSGLTSYTPVGKRKA